MVFKAICERLFGKSIVDPTFGRIRFKLTEAPDLHHWDLAEPVAKEVFRYFGAAPTNYRVAFSEDRDVLQHLQLGYIGIVDLDPPQIELEFTVPSEMVVDDSACEHPLCVRLVDWNVVTHASFGGWSTCVRGFAGVIRADNDGPGIGRDAWLGLVERRRELVPPLPGEGINPFTGEPTLFKPSPTAALLIVDDKQLGTIDWTQNVLLVYGNVDVVRPYAMDLAELLGGTFRGPRTTRAPNTD